MVEKNVYRLLVGNPAGKKPLGSQNIGGWIIKMDLVEIGWGGVDWMGLAHDRYKCTALVNAVMNLRVP
jgi:hypothetical protein